MNKDDLGVLPDANPRTGASFSIKNRLARILWNITYILFFRFSPRPMHFWRSFVLRCFGASIGKGCHIYPKVKIWAPWNLVVEDGVGIADEVQCYSMDKITIGKNTVISQGTYLCTGSHDYQSPNFQLYTMPIHIGADAWLCAQSFISPGVNIGSGAVIGARSVVTKDMPQWMVCAGNPCKPIKERKLAKI